MAKAQAVCVSHFADVVPKYYAKYQNGDYYQGYCQLMNCLPRKARGLQGLDKKDVLDIFDWGRGRQYKGRFENHKDNTIPIVQTRIREAYKQRNKPERAYRSVTDLRGLGLTYGSKILMFMDPENYVALDGWHMGPMLGALIGVARSDSKRSQVQAYTKFLDVCRDIQRQAIAPVPCHPVAYPNFPKDHKGRWLLSDIQQAIFQFIKEGNSIVPCCDACSA